jgi:PAS domain S-box-containing protein
MRILVVDDDPGGRYLLESILRSAGHEVLSAVDGADALEVAHREPPDLAISDILMPRMDGYQLCRAWKADEHLSSVPLVFYTASYTEPADERLALGLGVDAFWRKPLDARELLEAVASFGGPGEAHGARQPEFTDEAVMLEEYSARLVGKLEEKARSLEAANAGLRRAMELLAQEMAAKERVIDELNADVRERELAEAALRKERDFSRGALQLADLFICILDQERNVTLLSHGAERICGRPAREVMGADAALELVTPGSRAAFVRALEAVPASGVRRCEIEVPAAGGERHTIECVITSTLDDDGLPTTHNVFGVDVTERRRLEQMKSDFIQTVSHELRTPLTSIVGFVDLLGTLSAIRLEEQTPVIVERLRENADRMRGLVEELLEVNDIAAEGVTLALRPLDLGSVVRRSAEAVFRGPAHPLVVEMDADLPAVVCDGDRIARVVTNLVANAVKYSPDGGGIEVRVDATDGVASIQVRDHGIGIGPEEVGRLFERFSQADMSSTRSFGGLGLGLFIVSEITRAHGGSVDVESTPGEGSAFTVRIPVAGP